MFTTKLLMLAVVILLYAAFRHGDLNLVHAQLGQLSTGIDRALAALPSN